jgi:hypothetical protein
LRRTKLFSPFWSQLAFLETKSILTRPSGTSSCEDHLHSALRKPNCNLTLQTSFSSTSWIGTLFTQLTASRVASLKVFAPAFVKTGTNGKSGVAKMILSSLRCLVNGMKDWTTSISFC